MSDKASKKLRTHTMPDTYSSVDQDKKLKPAYIDTAYFQTIETENLQKIQKARLQKLSSPITSQKDDQKSNEFTLFPKLHKNIL